MQKVVQQLEALINEYAGKFKTLSEETLSYKPSTQKWSKKEILGHLIDSAQNNIQRFVRTQYEYEPHVVYNQDVWVAAQGYQNYPARELTELWHLLNRHICYILKIMPEEIYSRYCNTGKEGDELYTIKFIAEDYVTHHLHHLKQIF